MNDHDNVSYAFIARMRRVLDLPPGPPNGGDMEARVAKLEATVENIHRELSEMKTDVREVKAQAREDFRILFGAILAAAVGLAGLMAKGFHWL